MSYRRPTARDACTTCTGRPAHSGTSRPTPWVRLRAAQLFAAANDADASVRPSLAHGDFSPLVAFVHKYVHAEASRFDTDTALERATGSKLEENVLLKHLRARYLEN